ncbi:MFS transporter [Paraburkholderia tropica]|uniref:MFS transporter n=1 Tax=Paraburkholderia tropica TaxID=92647 RepID=UPI001FC7C7DD|nr:MFS transporter [Paraburkholderia tropica]
MEMDRAVSPAADDRTSRNSAVMEAGNLSERMNLNTSHARAVAPTKVRYLVLLALFFVTAINVGDRAALSITGSAIIHEFNLSPITLGYMFSVFAWAYVIGQLPGGLLLDRFGAVKVYGFSLLLWSIVTALQGMMDLLSPMLAVAALFALRFLLGLVESPVYPANSRMVTSWFPAKERGIATVIFNSSMYLSIALLAPMMGLIAHKFGWQAVYWTMGALGIGMSMVWFRFVKTPKTHPWVNAAELAHIESGTTPSKTDISKGAVKHKPSLKDLKVLLRSPMMWAIYLGKYCDTSLQYFFITWFPIYLVKYRGLNIMEAGALASIPALSGLFGALCGGAVSDALLRRGASLTLARKVPLVCGMTLGGTLLACNFTDSIPLIIAVMSLAIFGKGLVAVDWTLVSDTSPREIIGLSGGLFNMIGNLSGIITPVLIGYVITFTGSFEGAMFVVAGHAFVGALAFLLMGRVCQLTLGDKK